MSITSFTTSFGMTSPRRSVENETDPILVWNAKQVAIQTSSLILIFILALGGNFLIAFTLVKKDQLVLPSNRLVFSLTASNFALALLVFPFTVVSSIYQKWLFGIFWCNFTAFLTVLVATASLLTIAIIAIDRYHAIVKPMMYTLTITNARSSIFLLGVWFLAFVCAVPPLFGWSRFIYRANEAVCLIDWRYNVYYTFFMLTVCFFLPFIIMVICYYSILQVARTKCRKIHVGSVTDTCNNVPLSSLSSQRNSLSRKTSWFLLSYASPAKGFRTICILMGVYLVTCLPYASVCVIEASGQDHLLSRWLHIMAIGLIFFAAASHPVIYGLYNRSIRKEIKNYLCQSNSRSSSKGSQHTFRRLSISASLMDYSPFKLYRSNRARRTSADYNRAAVDVNNQIFMQRKGSQDSGTVMTESDVDSETSWGFHRWKRRVSAPSRLQFSRYQEIPQRSQCSHPLPILQNLSSKIGQTDSSLQLHDTPQDTFILQTANDVPSHNKVLLNKRTKTNEFSDKEEKVFEYSSQINCSVVNIDEGIVNDCIIEDLD